MRVTLTGATGLIGAKLVAALRGRGDEVTVLTRDVARARNALGDVAGVRWDPMSGPAPAEALAGRDAVVHLAGEPVAQRWNDDTKRRILDSRKIGTQNLVAGLRAVPEAERPGILLSASGADYYGPHGSEEVTEDTPPGDDYLAKVCIAWEEAADAAGELGMRVVKLRTGVVLDDEGGALAKMLPFFKLGIGGPVAGGKQYVPWIAGEDIVGLYLAALDGEDWRGAINATSPQAATNAELSKALGRALKRPAFAPVPSFAIKALYGEMAIIVTTGARVVPQRALELGYGFRHPNLDGALQAALGR
jgi:uncharacterized protein